MSGPMFCMPLVVINMGGEMVYILEQRLFAQNIGTEKSQKVLQDVLKTMYSSKFIKELFKPQEIYTNSSTREIFNKLAHSSIMRLNESSMDKLFDLMTMGFKHQLLLCSFPGQMLHVTINHLELLKSIAASAQINALIDFAIESALEVYGSMSPGEWVLLKQQLYNFCQGRRIKVSLFLQNNLQNMDGSFVLDAAGSPLPLEGDIPGKIRYYERAKLACESEFQTPAADGAKVFTSDFHTPLGTNLYSRDLGKVVSTLALRPPACATENVTRAIRLQIQQLARDSLATISRERSFVGSNKQKGLKATATQELNILAELLGASIQMAEEDHHHDRSKHFKINLFAEDTFNESDEEKGVKMLYLDATSERKTVREWIRELDTEEEKGSSFFEDKGLSSSSKRDDEDLLDLMDSMTGTK